MTPYYAGWLSLLPPVIAISLALIRKEVYSSLFIGILSGALIYSIGTDAAPFMGTLSSTCSVLSKNFNFDIVMFCSLLGSLVFVIHLAGASKAYGDWMGKKVNSRRKALLSTGSMGLIFFFDDYFNCLTVGTVMKPVTDRFRVAREKLAYIIDSTAGPICIIAPISSWAAAVESNLKSTGAFQSDFTAFVASIPYNFYAILSLITVAVLCFTEMDFGSMRRACLRAEEGDLGAEGTVQNGKFRPGDKGRVFDMVIPLAVLIVLAVVGMLYTGGYWGDDPKYASIGAAFGNCNSSMSLVWASLGALVCAGLLYVPRGLMSFHRFMEGSVEGVKIMLPANLVLVLAWGMSGVCRDLLQTPQFVEHLVTGGSFVAWLLPAAVFVIAAFLSFSMGTAWGTFGILIPIVVPIANTLDPQLLLVSLSAVLAGSVFGDHCSPISDTTILSSAGAGCNHLAHVSTQLPYALAAAGCSMLGYVACGLCGGSLWAGLGTAVASMLALLYVLGRKGREKAESEAVLADRHPSQQRTSAGC